MFIRMANLVARKKNLKNNFILINVYALNNEVEYPDRNSIE